MASLQEDEIRGGAPHSNIELTRGPSLSWISRSCVSRKSELPSYYRGHRTHTRLSLYVAKNNPPMAYWANKKIVAASTETRPLANGRFFVRSDNQDKWKGNGAGSHRHAPTAASNLRSKMSFTVHAAPRMTNAPTNVFSNSVITTSSGVLFA